METEELINEFKEIFNQIDFKQKPLIEEIL